MTIIDLPRARGKPPRSKKAGRRSDATPKSELAARRYHSRETEQLLAEIALWTWIQKPFGAVFWTIEQIISRLSDEVERRLS